MKTKTKNYWVFIVIIVVGNILIFRSFSNRLESFVVASTIDNIPYQAQTQPAQEQEQEKSVESSNDL